jgi:hypothetical protein
MLLESMAYCQRLLTSVSQWFQDHNTHTKNQVEHNVNTILTGTKGHEDADISSTDYWYFVPIIPISHLITIKRCLASARSRASSDPAIVSGDIIPSIYLDSI